MFIKPLLRVRCCPRVLYEILHLILPTTYEWREWVNLQFEDEFKLPAQGHKVNNNPSYEVGFEPNQRDSWDWTLAWVLWGSITPPEIWNSQLLGDLIGNDMCFSFPFHLHLYHLLTLTCKGYDPSTLQMIWVCQSTVKGVKSRKLKVLNDLLKVSVSKW